MPPALTHLALHVHDIGKSINFYREYCSMSITHDRNSDMDRVVWISEKGKENEFIIVLISGGKDRPAFTGEFSHLGFAVGSKQDVDLIAKKGEADGILVWPVTEEPYPVGYYCGLKDPDGNFVEFSYGQPLGPGAKE